MICCGGVSGGGFVFYVCPYGFTRDTRDNTRLTEVYVIDRARAAALERWTGVSEAISTIEHRLGRWKWFVRTDYGSG